MKQTIDHKAIAKKLATKTQAELIRMQDDEVLVALFDAYDGCPSSIGLDDHIDCNPHFLCKNCKQGALEQKL